MSAITYGTAQTLKDLKEIITLQQQNLETALTQEIIEKEGFVTVQHDEALLKQMNEPYPHVVARHQDKIIGYTLIMLPDLKNAIPILIPMFEKIEQSFWNEKKVKDHRYFVMGQVCIDKTFRGKGIFDGLFLHLKQQMQADFDLIVTEVATRNVRSLKAHQRVGFKHFLSYTSDQENWELIAWEI